MSTKIPIIKVKIFEKILISMGFEIKRQSGSHVFYGILMVVIPPFLIMGTRIWADL